MLPPDDRTTVLVLPELEVPGRRLGRHVEHDPLSRGFEAVVHARNPKPVTRRWRRRSPILDQGSIGSCVGNTFAGWLACDTALRKGRSDVDQDLALRIYERATRRDRLRGVFRPQDTGSTGLAGAKALVDLGLSAGPYRHTFSLDSALSALAHVGPLCVGIDWPEGMDEPDALGQVVFSGAVRGGHEQLWTEIDVERQRVWFDQSWGPDWGVKGRAWLSITDFGRALEARGDVVVITA